MENKSEGRGEVTLRPFELSDVDHFLKWAGDDQVTRYLRWDTFTSRDSAFTFLNQMINSHPWYRAICVDDRPIGSMFVLPGTGKDQRKGEIGYAISADYWGKGVGTEAVKMVKSCIFKELEYLDRVEAFVHHENVGSQKVLEKAGFLKEGVLRKFYFFKGKSMDIVAYSITNTNY